MDQVCIVWVEYVVYEMSVWVEYILYGLSGIY